MRTPDGQFYLTAGYQAHLSKKLCQFLRHKGVEYNLDFDSGGYVSLRLLLRAFNSDVRKPVDSRCLVHVMANSIEGRFGALRKNDQVERVRCNQGHSATVASLMEESVVHKCIEQVAVPVVASHLTKIGNLQYILSPDRNVSGLKPGGPNARRTHVHFSPHEWQDTRRVDTRLLGDCEILLNTPKFVAEGNVGHISPQGVILTGYVDVRYIKRVTLINLNLNVFVQPSPANAGMADTITCPSCQRTWLQGTLFCLHPSCFMALTAPAIWSDVSRFLDTRVRCDVLQMKYGFSSREIFNCLGAEAMSKAMRPEQRARYEQVDTVQSSRRMYASWTTTTPASSSSSSANPAALGSASLQITDRIRAPRDEVAVQNDTKIKKQQQRAFALGFLGHTNRYDTDYEYQSACDRDRIPRVIYWKNGEIVADKLPGR
jgi:RNA:NAD 2'-phosphotransferase (TPT1/KptA family)